MMLLTALAALVVLFSLSLSFGAKMPGNTAGGRELTPVPSSTPTGPKYKVVNLGCSTGVLHTYVTNSSGVNIPASATITVHGNKPGCTQTFKGPFAKKAQKDLLGCAEPVTTCVASAKWELGLE